MIRLWFGIGAAVGAAIAVWGTVLVLTPPRLAGFGWTAYAPLSSTTYAPPAAPELPGLVLALAGAVLLGAGITGAALARRPR